MAYKQQQNKTSRLIRLTKRAFFVKGARKGSKTFWRNVKQYAGLGRLKQLINPWPCASVRQATASATKLNQHFIASVTRLTSTVSSTHSVKTLQVNPL